MLGTIVGGQFATLLPEQLFTVIIAVFVLVTTWLPQPRVVGRSRAVQFFGGAVISGLSMLVGATGPLVAVFLKGLQDRQQLVATHAMLMTFQNAFKVVVFVVLGFAFAASVTRISRSAMLDVLSDDYIRTARAKGVPARSVVWRHALPNALIPVVTLSGVEFGYLLGGAVIVEQIFALPGLGRLTLDAIGQRDYALVQGCVLFVALNFLIVNLLVDLAYAALDPRIRLGAR